MLSEIGKSLTSPSWMRWQCSHSLHLNGVRLCMQMRTLGFAWNAYSSFKGDSGRFRLIPAGSGSLPSTWQRGIVTEHLFMSTRWTLRLHLSSTLINKSPRFDLHPTICFLVTFSLINCQLILILFQKLSRNYSLLSFNILIQLIGIYFKRLFWCNRIQIEFIIIN